MIDVPMRLEDISAEWLTAALREGGLRPRSRMSTREPHGAVPEGTPEGER